MHLRRFFYTLLLLLGLVASVSNCQQQGAGGSSAGCSPGASGGLSFTDGSLEGAPVDIPVTIAKNTSGIDPSSITFVDSVSGSQSINSYQLTTQIDPQFSVASDALVGTISGRLFSQTGVVGVIIDGILEDQITVTNYTFTFAVYGADLNKGINFVVYENETTATTTGGDFSSPVTVTIKLNPFTETYKATVAITFNSDDSSDSDSAYEIENTELATTGSGTVGHLATRSDGAIMLITIAKSGGATTTISSSLPAVLGELNYDASGNAFGVHPTTGVIYKVASTGVVTTIGATSSIPTNRHIAMHPSGTYLAANVFASNSGTGNQSQSVAIYNLSSGSLVATITISGESADADDLTLTWSTSSSIFAIKKFSTTSYKAQEWNVSGLIAGTSETATSNFSFTRSSYMGNPTSDRGVAGNIYYLCTNNGTTDLCGYNRTSGDLGAVVQEDYNVVTAHVSYNGAFVALQVQDVIAGETENAIAVYDIEGDAIDIVAEGEKPKVFKSDQEMISYITTDEDGNYQVGISGLLVFDIEEPESTLAITGDYTQVGPDYSMAVVGSGGTPPYTYAIVSGSGSVDQSTGTFLAPSSAGTTVIKVTDANGNTKNLSVTVTGAVSLSANNMSYGASQTLAASGGTGSYTYSIVSGGGSINASTGAYTAPSSSGNVTLRATDSYGESTTTVISILSNNANLSSLLLSAGDLSPSFSANTTTYTAAVGYLAKSTTVTPTVDEIGVATVKVNNVSTTSGSVSSSISLSEGANAISVKVTAEDGTNKTYSLTVTRDGSGDFAQQAYVKASNAADSDFFASSIAMSGDTIVVGARAEDSNATGVNGDQSNNDLSGSGAVYVFRKTNGTWAQEAYIKASNPTADDGFGWKVAIDGDTLVVGVPYEDSNATGINGDESNNDALQSGAVYVFVRDGTTWSQQAYIKASNTGDGDQFGWSVDISSDTLVVGAWFEDSDGTGINGTQNNDDALSSGAAYVFVRDGTTWTQQAYLKASNAATTDFFGASVSIDGETIVIGATGESSDATGVNGDENNDDVAFSGAAYVFVRDGTTWTQQAYLKASNTGANDSFGVAVAISGDTVAVGAHQEDSDATGIDGADNDGAPQSGAVYVFVRSGVTWTHQAYIKSSNSEGPDQFGGKIQLDGNTLVVGARYEDSDTTGVNSTQNNDGTYRGAVYVFERSGVTWSQTFYLKASNSGDNDSFSEPVIDGGIVAVAASYEDSSATGIGGDQNNDDLTNSGAFYIFE